MKLAGHQAERSTSWKISITASWKSSNAPRPTSSTAYSGNVSPISRRPAPAYPFSPKGEAAEQAAKVERSGLQIHFDAIEIVPEKDAATYRALVNRHHVVKSHGWMVGNSPRSDINPALEAGLNAVFIPHHATWALEHEEVRSGAGRLLIVTNFRALREHF